MVPGCKRKFKVEECAEKWEDRDVTFEKSNIASWKDHHYCRCTCYCKKGHWAQQLRVCLRLETTFTWICFIMAASNLWGVWSSLSSQLPQPTDSSWQAFEFVVWPGGLNLLEERNVQKTRVSRGEWVALVLLFKGERNRHSMTGSDSWPPHVFFHKIYRPWAK